MKNNKSNSKNIFPMIDERQERTVGSVSSFIVIITFIYLITEITYKYISTKDILTASWEIVLILLIGTIYTIGMRLEKEINLPTNFLGKKLPIDNSKKSKKSRIKAYLLKSLAFSTAITAITLFFTYFIEVEERLGAIEYVGEFLGLIAVSFVLSYIFGEYNIKKYHKYMESLDN